MTRSSIRTFLVTAKKHLKRAMKDQTHASFVVGNESADLDSITCALVYGYIQSNTVKAQRAGEIFIPVTNIPSSDLPLRPELTALLKHAYIQPEELITLDDLDVNALAADKTQWTLVDHNALTGLLAQHYSSRIASCIDHHEDERTVSRDASPRIIDKAGSCNSLMVNETRPDWDVISSAATSVWAARGQDDTFPLDDTAYTNTWDAQIAKLSLASILIDTHNLKDENKVTEHDRKAVRYLEARINASQKLGKDYDRDNFFAEINGAKTQLDHLSLKDILRKDYKQWEESGCNLGISSVVKPIEYLSSKSEKWRQECVEFAKERNLQLFAIMTAYSDEGGKFARQLVLMGTGDEKAAPLAEKFVSNAESKLQLSLRALDGDEVAASSIGFYKSWKQGNLGASRKQVGPLLREAMR